MKDGRSIEKYQKLARELKKIWKVKSEIIPVGIGHLCTEDSSKRIKKLDKIVVKLSVELVQKTALLGMTKIL